MGGVLSIFTGGEVYVAVFPATSATVTLPVTADPSTVSTRGLGAEVEASPDKASVAVKGTFTFVLFQPAALATGTAAPKATTGGGLSGFTVGDMKVAEVPAIFVAGTGAVT